MKVIPVILCSGAGEGLWPLARKSKPKQFLNFGSSRSLFQETVLRCHGDEFDRKPIVAGAYEDRFHIMSNLQEIDAQADILVAPSPLNPAAAMAAGCLKAMEREEDVLVVAINAENRVTDSGAFEDAVISATTAEQEGYLVSFGLKPDGPETGHGYIKPGDKLPASNVLEVDGYTENPSAKTAKKYVKEGYLWNSGDFLLSAKEYLAALKEHAPEVYKGAVAAFENAAPDLEFTRLDAQALAGVETMSIEATVIDKSKKAAVLPVDYGWLGMKSWTGIWNALDKDDAGNAILGDGQIIGGKNNLVHSDGRYTALLGIDDAVVVAMRDSILVAAKNRSGDVAQIVDGLREENRPEADETLEIFQPWGNFERLDAGEKYQVRRVVVEPGEKISLQKHEHRGEHWILVQGRAEVTVDGHSRVRGTNESVYIPRNSAHELVNNEAEPVVIIEVQTGNYLGEDDIVRIEDAYNLGAGAVPVAEPAPDEAEEPEAAQVVASVPKLELPNAKEVATEAQPAEEQPAEEQPAEEAEEVEAAPEEPALTVTLSPVAAPAPRMDQIPQPAPAPAPEPAIPQEETASLRKPFPPPAPRAPASTSAEADEAPSEEGGAGAGEGAKEN
ncbi:MAG: mannose-1-phosphate guanylyltransferase/mannose-6-phosphate isomerase [Hyphomicrobiales bacterium]